MNKIVLAISDDSITTILDEEGLAPLLSIASKVEINRASNVEFDNEEGSWYFDTAPIVIQWMKKNWKIVPCTVCTAEGNDWWVKTTPRDVSCINCRNTGYNNWRDIIRSERHTGFATRQEALDAEVRWLEQFLKDRG